jgi:hypothetical protein
VYEVAAYSIDERDFSDTCKSAAEHNLGLCRHPTFDSQGRGVFESVGTVYSDVNLVRSNVN